MEICVTFVPLKLVAGSLLFEVSCCSFLLKKHFIPHDNHKSPETGHETIFHSLSDILNSMNSDDLVDEYLFWLEGSYSQFS